MVVDCVDLSQCKLDPELVRKADVIGIYLAMHTATRIAMEVLPKMRAANKKAVICAYGLYAPMNAKYLKSNGVDEVFGAEFENELLNLAIGDTGTSGLERDLQNSVPKKIDFLVPDRSSLPALENYAHLIMPDSSRKTVGSVEATRGCKHLCRHCPVVPVYNGKFRAIKRDVVLQDIRNQVAAGAEHISFGDPDFLNGPTHSLKILREMHDEFPSLTFDATVKIEHIISFKEHISEWADLNCLFVVSAVESIDDKVTDLLLKGHSYEDFVAAVGVLSEVGISLSPTFIPFTPWTSLESYIQLLKVIYDMNLVEAVQPVQLSIRLLVPEGSHILKIDGIEEYLTGFDPVSLGYQWKNPDGLVDQMQLSIHEIVSECEAKEMSRTDIFEKVWNLAHQYHAKEAPRLTRSQSAVVVPRLSEPWYCCAEPTEQQLTQL